MHLKMGMFGDGPANVAKSVPETTMTRLYDGPTLQNQFILTACYVWHRVKYVYIHNVGILAKCPTKLLLRVEAIN